MTDETRVTASTLRGWSSLLDRVVVGTKESIAPLATTNAEIMAAAAATAARDAELQDALVELQAAAWSRSWGRVKAARKRVRELLGMDVPGPLSHALQKLMPEKACADCGRDMEVGPGGRAIPIVLNDKGICAACVCAEEEARA